MMSRTLSWFDIEPTARKVFSIWMGHPEINWAKQAWDYVINQGLANYSDESEKTWAVVRFIALASIYLRYCEIAWSEEVFFDYPTWAEELGLSADNADKLIGNADEYEDFAYENKSFHTMLGYLAYQVRYEVFLTIKAGFGDEIKLYDSLIHSTASSDEWEKYRKDGEFDGQGDIPSDETTVMSWIMQGCPA